jgi:ribonuclease Z
MAPTKDRNVQGIFLSYKAEGILVDCGEGTQRQMNLVGINRNKVTMILITHWHGDHVGGIIGLLQTISDKDNPPKVEIYGPKETKKRIQHLLDSVIFDGNNLDLRIHELNPKAVETFLEKDDFILQCAPMDHTTPCIAYSFVEKDTRKVKMSKAKALGLREGPNLGKLQKGVSIVLKGKTIKPDDVSFIKKGRKISFVFDTIPNQNAYDLAKEADLLVCESVYLPDMQENSAKYKHLTTQDAALIATNANVKELIITHFSQRYKSNDILEENIRTFFDNASAAYDFKKVRL